MEKGSVQIYYGAGRGKTNAALGNALRAAGENKSVIIIQFLKGKTDDQIAYMKQLEPEIKVFRFDTVRHAGVGDHYSSATGKSLKLFSRRKNLFTNSDVARENNVSVSSSRECIR